LRFTAFVDTGRVEQTHLSLHKILARFASA